MLPRSVKRKDGFVLMANARAGSLTWIFEGIPDASIRLDNCTVSPKRQYLCRKGMFNKPIILLLTLASENSCKFYYCFPHKYLFSFLPLLQQHPQPPDQNALRDECEWAFLWLDLLPTKTPMILHIWFYFTYRDSISNPIETFKTFSAWFLDSVGTPPTII